MKSVEPTVSRSRIPSSYSQNRWKWMASSAALAAGATGIADAGTVQINLGNRVNSLNGFINQNTIAATPGQNLDITGDRNDDIFSLTASAIGISGGSSIYQLALRSSGGQMAIASWIKTGGGSTSYLGDVPAASITTGSNQSRTGFVPVSFTDSRINGGAETTGLLEVNAANLDKKEQRITFVRLIFDDANTAKPTGVMFDDNFPQWVDPAVIAAQRSKLLRKIKKKKKALRRAKKSGNRNKIKRIKKQIRKFRKELRAL